MHSTGQCNTVDDRSEVRRGMAKIGRPELPSQRRQQAWERWKAGSSISKIPWGDRLTTGITFLDRAAVRRGLQAPQRSRPGTLTVADREETSGGLAAGESYRATGPSPRPARIDNQPRGRQEQGPRAAIGRSTPTIGPGGERGARRPPCPRSVQCCAMSRPTSSPETVPKQTLGAGQPPPGWLGDAQTTKHCTRLCSSSHRGVDQTAAAAPAVSAPDPAQFPQHRHRAVTFAGHRRAVDPATSRPSREPGHPAHWEGYLLCGRHWIQVATAVERATRFAVLVQLDNREMTTVTAGLN